MSMSDEDREVDIESDADDKRAHHNALERKRRDHIKDSFHSLRDCVPQDTNKASRAQILRQAAEYIIRMRDKTIQNDRHINILKQQNDELLVQIKALQKSQLAGKSELSSHFHNDRGDDDYESYEEEAVATPPPKRKKAKSSKS